MLGVATEKTVLFESLEMVTQGARCDATLACNQFLRGPAAALRVGAVGERHQHQLTTARKTLVPCV
jgi:hypothetical protein